MPIKDPSTEQFWKLQEKLPMELKDAVWSAETGDDIYEAITKYGVAEHGQKISWLVGQVLLGLLLPQEFPGEIEKLGIQKDAAEKIAREINRLVFYPVKPALEQLHRMEIEVTAKVVTPQPEEQESSEKQGEDDKYREELE